MHTGAHRNGISCLDNSLRFYSFFKVKKLFLKALFFCPIKFYLATQTIFSTLCLATAVLQQTLRFRRDKERCLFQLKY